MTTYDWSRLEYVANMMKRFKEAEVVWREDVAREEWDYCRSFAIFSVLARKGYSIAPACKLN